MLPKIALTAWISRKSRGINKSLKGGKDDARWNVSGIQVNFIVNSGDGLWICFFDLDGHRKS
jgi:hypothetical protein